MSAQPDTDQHVAVRIDPDGTITPIGAGTSDTATADVDDLAPLPGERACIVWVSRHRNPQLARNDAAETLWFLAGDRGCLANGETITGPCVLTGPADDNGELQPVPSWVLDTAAAVTASTTRRSRRFPMTPLENWLNTRYHNLSASADRQCGGLLSTARIAELIGFTRQAVHRWRAEGVPLWSADRAATNAGAHPLELWPDFHADLADGDQTGGTA